MWNPVNEWIREAKDHEGKFRRRVAVGAVFLGLGALLGLSVHPLGFAVCAVGIVKFWNAWKDKS